jgi:hypothetical protein
MIQRAVNQDDERSLAAIIPIVQFEPVRAQLM